MISAEVVVFALVMRLLFLGWHLASLKGSPENHPKPNRLFILHPCQEFVTGPLLSCQLLFLSEASRLLHQELPEPLATQSFGPAGTC